MKCYKDKLIEQKEYYTYDEIRKRILEIAKQYKGTDILTETKDNLELHIYDMYIGFKRDNKWGNLLEMSVRADIYQSGFSSSVLAIDEFSFNKKDVDFIINKIKCYSKFFQMVYELECTKDRYDYDYN